MFKCYHGQNQLIINDKLAEDPLTGFIIDLLLRTKKVENDFKNLIEMSKNLKTPEETVRGNIEATALCYSYTENFIAQKTLPGRNE